ncbi:MAG: crotonase/enoyl-CoA hydratase family protein [Burkholderiales bacterium]|nr:crotonase/enoyl-CoA hydratase family protein [Burkholderiales bacterium]OUT79298.1 MAG: enoyl-CoA hydratase [Betaproteobacteria bacterium TMED22]|tara:strand:+ start:15997 stop:16788 length:792 start_codon:yes stop_codon:yes gene_type:complete
MSTFLNIQESGSIMTLTMNEPATRNALTGNTAADEFVAICERINLSKHIKAVIVTGSGPVFSAGGNLKDMKQMLDDDLSSEVIRESYRQGIQRIPLALYDLEVPTIAAVNGPAIGAGCDLACMCDIRIGSSISSFAESFVKVGIIPGDGGAWFLPRVIGMAKAAELSFTGDRIDAKEALRIGLISYLTAPETLMAEAEVLATRIAANPGLILRMTKKLLREGQRQDLPSLLELSANLQSIAQKTPDHHEAVNAFLEKRTPKFQ